MLNRSLWLVSITVVVMCECVWDHCLLTGLADLLINIFTTPPPQQAALPWTNIFEIIPGTWWRFIHKIWNLQSHTFTMYQLIALHKSSVSIQQNSTFKIIMVEASLIPCNLLIPFTPRNVYFEQSCVQSISCSLCIPFTKRHFKHVCFVK